MVVKQNCSVDGEGVRVNLATGEELEYVIEVLNGQATYVLSDEHGNVLANSESCPSPCKRRWPQPNDHLPGPPKIDHILAVQFLSPGTVKYTVRHFDADGTPVADVVDCAYVNDGEPDSHFKGLTVYL